MKNNLIAWLIGTIALNFTSAMGAMLILQPTVNHLLQPHIRSQADGLNFVGLLVGYAIMSATIVLIFSNLKNGQSWLKRGLLYGAILGFGVCIGGHLVVSGWSYLQMGPMTFSGFVDAISFTISSIAISFFVRENKPA